MAGGKLTPRQKMINMMYLVLTALLALNVSAEILLSFQTIADSLSRSAENSGKRNHELGDRIKEAVQKMQAEKTAKAHHMKIPGMVDETIKKTDEVIDALNKSITDLSSPPISEIDKETQRIANLGESEKNFQYLMIGKGKETDNNRRGAGRAKEMRDMLETYVKWANDRFIVYGKDPTNPNAKDNPTNANNFSLLCLDPKDDPKIPKNAEARQYTWEYYTFHGAPVIANIAIFEKLKTDVNAIEAELLETLKRQLVDLPPFKIDSLIAVDAPTSRVVVAGLPFETKIYVTAISKDMKPRFAGGIQADKGGNSGTLKMTASGAVVPAGRSDGKQSYGGTVYVKNSNGKEIPLQVKGQFTVVKPVVKIEGKSVSNLYLGCANPLIIDVPQLSSVNMYFPDIKLGAGQGEVQAHPTRKTDWRIIPTGRSCDILVNNRLNGQSTLIEKITFKVIPPPLPDVALKVNNREWDGTSRISAKARLEVYMRPEKNFAAQLEKEARYQIKTLVVKKKAGLGAPKPLKTYENGPIPDDGKDSKGINIPLAGIWNDGGPSTGGIILQVTNVARVNFKGQQFPITDEFKSERDLMIVGFVEEQ